MRDSVLLLSMPNCGSDWLAKTIILSQEGCKYFREFFNPAVNFKHADILEEEFGCEYITCYKKIIDYSEYKAENIYNNTWKIESYNFTKENYSFTKIPFYLNHFKCFALIRDVKNSLPAGRRTEVNSWYLGIYQSLLENKSILPDLIRVKIEHFTDKKTRIDDKVVFAFCVYQELFNFYCKKYKVPIISYENILNLDLKKEVGALTKISPYSKFVTNQNELNDLKVLE